VEGPESTLDLIVGLGEQGTDQYLRATLWGMLVLSRVSTLKQVWQLTDLDQIVVGPSFWRQSIDMPRLRIRVVLPSQRGGRGGGAGPSPSPTHPITREARQPKVEQVAPKGREQWTGDSYSRAGSSGQRLRYCT